MAKPLCSDEEFIRLFKAHGSCGLAKVLNADIRGVRRRRKRIENELGFPLISELGAQGKVCKERNEKYPYRVEYGIENGCGIVASDWHIWPGYNRPSYRALRKIGLELGIKFLVLNGDVVDGAKISRHPPLGWSHLPTVKEEFETVQEIIGALESDFKSADRFWTLGNHDMRFEMRLAAQAGEFEGVAGFRLADHFPAWFFCWSIWVNDDVVIKHRFKNGIHATHNNTLWAGKSIITSHLHSGKVSPFDDYNGTRYGVDTGTMNDPHGEHTEYVEDNPLNHRESFAVLTFRDGMLLNPELVYVVDDNNVQFRGQIIPV